MELQEILSNKVNAERAERMKILKFERPSISGCWLGISQEQFEIPNNTAIEEIRLMFTEDEVGEQIILTLIEMSDEEFAELQENEFQGW